MAIDFGGLATTDNYSTAYTPKINEAVKALAYMLDPAYASYTGTPFNNAKRFNGGALEKFNGSSWVAQPLAGGYNGTVGATTPSTGAFTTLSATGVVRFDGASGNGVHFYNGATLLADLYDDGTAWRFQNRSGAPRNWDFYVADVLRASVSSTGLAVTGALSATGSLTTAGLQEVSGNLGLGVTPSAWSLGKAFENSAGSFFGYTSELHITQNSYYNSGWKYTSSGFGAGRYFLNSGTHNWYTAPTGTAGAAITFTQAMTLDASGNLSAVGSITSVTPGSAYAGIGAGVGSSLGYLGFYTSVGVRQGYIGAGTSAASLDAGTIPYVAGTHAFTGAVVMSSTLGVTKRAYTSSASVSFSATPTFDASASNFQIFGALTANVTSVTLSNAQEGQFLTIRFTQDGTGGRTITTGNMGATNAPSIQGAPSTTANKSSYLNLTYNATAARWEGSWLATV